MLLSRHVRRIGLATLLLTVACAAREPGSVPKPGFNLFSKEQDVQLGKEASQQVLQQYEVVRNQFLQDYLNTVGRRLAGTPEASQSGFPFTFTLLNSKEVNAFALPGGPMFVFTGLVNDVDNEAQLVGVMAHEMSHVILRHGTNQASKANLLQIPAMLAGAVVGNGSLLGQLAQVGVGLGFNSVLLKFSRTDESQADALGARMMAEAGYNPIEMARFFEKLDASGGSRGPQFLSDHPNPGNREKAIENEIRSFPRTNYNADIGQFQRVRQEVAALPPPSKKGNLRSAASPEPSGGPSGQWQQLRGRTFTVAYPGNWQAFGDSNSAAVTLAPREGIVQTSDGGGAAIGYGAVLSYFQPDGNATDLRSATDDLIHHLRAQNSRMQVVSRSPQRVKVDGGEGLITMLESTSPYGGDETDALLTVARPEGLFYMVFVAPQKQFNNLQSAFTQMIRSIRFAS